MQPIRCDCFHLTQTWLVYLYGFSPAWTIHESNKKHTNRGDFFQKSYTVPGTPTKAPKTTSFNTREWIFTFKGRQIHWQQQLRGRPIPLQYSDFSFPMDGRLGYEVSYSGVFSTTRHYMDFPSGAVIQNIVGYFYLIRLLSVEVDKSPQTAIFILWTRFQAHPGVCDR